MVLNQISAFSDDNWKGKQLSTFNQKNKIIKEERRMKRKGTKKEKKGKNEIEKKEEKEKDTDF